MLFVDSQNYYKTEIFFTILHYFTVQRILSAAHYFRRRGGSRKNYATDNNGTYLNVDRMS